MDIARLRLEIKLDKRMKEFEGLIQALREKEEREKQRGTASEYRTNQSPVK